MSVVKLATTHEPLVIFSATDTQAVKSLLDARGVPYERVVGRYVGKMEYSFVVRPDAVCMVAEAGHLDDQECVLYLEAAHGSDQRHAWFAYLNLAPEQYAGIFRRTVYPAPNEGYTYVDKTYWVIRENVSRQKMSRWMSALANMVFGRIQRAVKPV